MRGLVPATTTPYTVAEDPDANWIGCGDTQGAVAVPVTIPAGTTHYRVGIYEDAITPTGHGPRPVRVSGSVPRGLVCRR